MPRAFVEISFTDLLRIVDELGASERLALMRHLGVDIPRVDEASFEAAEPTRPGGHHRPTRPPGEDEPPTAVMGRDEASRTGEVPVLGRTGEHAND